MSNRTCWYFNLKTRRLYFRLGEQKMSGKTLWNVRDLQWIGKWEEWDLIKKKSPTICDNVCLFVCIVHFSITVLKNLRWKEIGAFFILRVTGANLQDTKIKESEMMWKGCPGGCHNNFKTRFFFLVTLSEATCGPFLWFRDRWVCTKYEQTIKCICSFPVVRLFSSAWKNPTEHQDITTKWEMKTSSWRKTKNRKTNKRKWIENHKFWEDGCELNKLEVTIAFNSNIGKTDSLANKKVKVNCALGICGEEGEAQENWALSKSTSLLSVSSQLYEKVRNLRWIGSEPFRLCSSRAAFYAMGNVFGYVLREIGCWKL